MKGSIRQRNKTGRTERESGELTGEFMEGNTVQRAVKTETDTRTEQKGVGKLGGFMSKTYVKDINRNIPTT